VLCKYNRFPGSKNKKRTAEITPMEDNTDSDYSFKAYITETFILAKEISNRELSLKLCADGVIITFNAVPGWDSSLSGRSGST